jgi:hypothetical protein
MSFQNTLNDFVTQLAIDYNVGQGIVELSVDYDLFMKIMLEFDTQFPQGDMFRGYKELPKYMKLATAVGYVQINRIEK